MLQTAIYAIAPYKDLKQMEDAYNKELRSIFEWAKENSRAIVEINKEKFDDAEHFVVYHTKLHLPPNTAK